MPETPDAERDLERMADSRQPGIASELLEFLRDNKKWWMIPILAVLAVFGLVAVLASTPAAPFIYSLF